MNVGVYATYEEVKEYLQGEEAKKLPKDDTLLKKFCVDMSRKFDRECGDRRFYPVKETRLFDHPGWANGNDYPTDSLNQSLREPAFSSSTLWLYDDLLEIHTLTTRNGEQTISSNDYLLMNGARWRPSPYNKIFLKETGTVSEFSYEDTPLQSNTVAGIWGCHNDWANAWQQVDTVQSNPLSSSATSVTVSDVDGLDETGIEGRFKVQQLVRFGSGENAEYSYITAVNPDANTFSCVRGVNGTTAVAHLQNTAIYVYRPMAELKHAALALASWAYRRKDSVGTEIDQPIASATGVVIMPATLPGEVRQMIAHLMRDSL